ncbi:glycosyltransferase [Cellulomonas palmilytica]|uniref:glycosyltransferase n=1 Tax=Cellulomonas palmilytica TaxID=2608402 RepID=UPI001F43AB5A|nr:glycosyltransferase [Cellulomonas palmilytica]UJP39540.1 glycosyltransferase [Cellulomonas palmilytica]
MRPPKHLLYLAWGFPPSRAGGVYRALATVNAFAAAGWDVTVVTASRETFERYTGADTSLEALVDPRVTVRRIGFDWPAQDTDIRRYPALRVALPPVWARLRRLADEVPFPEASYGPWRAPLAAAARAVHDEHAVDLTLATANPHVTFAAAHDLFRTAGVPYVMDYRDAWRLDVFSGATTASPRSRVGRWERRLVADAREVWFVNEPIRAWHQERYPDAAARMHVVANGWDPGLLEVPLARTPHPGPGLRLAYLGTVTPKVPLTELLAGWRLALADGRLPAGSTLTLGGHLGYFAVPQGTLAQAVADAAADGVRYVGPVAKAEVSRFYADADALVLALGSGRYVSSGKVYEYVAAGRPVVAVHDPRNATTDVLAEHPLVARVAAVTPDEVARALGEVPALVAAAPAHADELARLALAYRRDAQLAPRVTALGAAVGQEVA